MTAPNPILVEKYRGNTVESFHRGAVCIIDASGKIQYSAGNPYQIVFPRSALKFSQQIPLIESGAAHDAGLTEEETAITCGSHNGEDIHCQAVRSILKKADTDESALMCGPQPPTLKEDRQALYKSGSSPLPVHNNCSGKHAGFILLSRHLECEDPDYINPEHPVQKMVKNAVAAIHEFNENKMDTALDGCSAPIFSMPLYNLALGMKNMLFPNMENENRVKACNDLTRLITHYPYMIAGKKRYCTDLMTAGNKKIIAKTGADGIFVLASPDQKWICAIKIDDGSMGPQYAVAQEIIRKSGLLSKNTLESLEHYRIVNVKNWAKRTTGITKVKENALAELSF